MFKNQHDTRNALDIGRLGEEKFKRLALERGYRLRLPDGSQDYLEHWDVEIIKATEHYLVDVKAMKRVKGQIQGLWVWVELTNVAGKPGWLYSSKADLFAFETENGFILVRPDPLKRLVSERVEDKRVRFPEHAHYCLYQRDGRGDIVTLISMADMKSVTEEIWEE